MASIIQGNGGCRRSLSGFPIRVPGKFWETRDLLWRKKSIVALYPIHTAPNEIFTLRSNKKSLEIQDTNFVIVIITSAAHPWLKPCTHKPRICQEISINQNPPSQIAFRALSQFYLHLRVLQASFRSHVQLSLFWTLENITISGQSAIWKIEVCWEISFVSPNNLLQRIAMGQRGILRNWFVVTNENFIETTGKLISFGLWKCSGFPEICEMFVD